jgi:hypothetical protein
MLWIVPDALSAGWRILAGMSDNDVPTVPISRLQRITVRSAPPGDVRPAAVSGPASAEPIPERSRTRGSRPRHARKRRRPTGLRLTIVVAIVLMLITVATVAVAWPTIGRHASAPPRVTTADADWSAIVQELDRRRHAAFVAGHEDDLAAVYARGSPAGQRDLASFRQMAAAGLRPRGLGLRLGSVETIDVLRGRADLRVIDLLPGYELVDPAGRVARRYRGRGLAAWTLTLVRTNAGWRIHDVVRSQTGGGGRQ